MDRVPPAHPRGGRTEPLGKIADHARWAQGATNRGRSREDKEWIRGTARLTPMRNLLTELLGHLNLERIEENLFRGQSQDLGWGRVFGGQILAQALSAARHTVSPERAAHSLHAYFLRPGSVDRPVVYTVDPIRDGGSFTTRRVVAVQNGQAILNLAASFQTHESGFEHADPMPSAPPPDALADERELGQRYLAGLPEAVLARIPQGIRDRTRSPHPIEIRPVAPVDPLKPGTRPPRRQVWIRAAAPLPDRPEIHRMLLAYASDFHLLTTSLQPHGVTWMDPGVQVASLDHSMWFHRAFRIDHWLLYDLESPSASGARGIVRGRFFDPSGRLVASVVQEGLIRDRRS